MQGGLVAYRWTCPICSAQKSSLSTEDEATIVGQAENALLSHVRTRDGSGHGREGDVPSDIDADDVTEHVEVDDVELSSGETSPYA